ncbi:MAG: radical SAM family heme chaperone HemW [Brevefilum sp.]|nr:radical SAM family heme chaperone HemW [Brevefilum sp.]MDT8380981.1 radical SAM family heme chaperone HemW [Brevefilum sp.]MDW7753608.1 radical SAM family heme chaperone HemW [Brevefilum sp.]
MDHSLYIHIPFCRHRCHYCDFNTSTGQSGLIPAYIEALIKELRIVSLAKPNIPIHSIYFGGGTPSLIPASMYEKILNAIKAGFKLSSDCEISLEANPGTLNQEYLTGLYGLGFNRISIGVQSLDPFDLVRLDRIHSIWDVLESVRYARFAGFDNINLDLIFGLPWQDLETWRKTLLRAIDLSPEHFSIYSLIIEPGTPLFNWYQKGLIKQQDQDLEADMYELTIDTLKGSNYGHYEISNWAKKDQNRDFRCRHNLQYWLGYPYLGIGAGAHGFSNGFRTINTLTIHDYIERMSQENHMPVPFPGTPAQISMDAIDLKTQMSDFMMVGLRLVKEGVSERRFSKLFGRSMTEIFSQEIIRLIDQGLIEWSEGEERKLHLTRRGIFLANRVFMAFV